MTSHRQSSARRPPSAARCGRVTFTIAPAGRPLAGLLLGAAMALVACGHSASDEEGKPAHTEAVAAVVSVPVRQGTLVGEQEAYGVVVPAPGAERAFSVPFESRVRAVHVVAGQTVTAGTSLVSLEPSAEGRVAIQQARAALAAERVKLDAVQQRYDLELATRDELAGQQQAYADAQTRWTGLAAWQDRQMLTAPVDGTVDSLLVGDGELVAAGAAMVSVVTGGRFEVRLGVEPEIAAALREGQAVDLSPVDRSGAAVVGGAVRRVVRKVDPDTRLVEVRVTPESPSSLFLAEAVRLRLHVTSAAGLLVPRQAVLPQEDEHVLYTVANGQAHRHTVQIGLHSADEVVVSGDLSPGDSVVVLGNYELEDGMHVRLETSGGAPPASAATGSAEQPAASGAGQ